MKTKFAYILGEIVEKIYDDLNTIPPHYFMLNEIVYFDSDTTKVELGYHYKDGKFFEPPLPDPFESRPYFINTIQQQETTRLYKTISHKAICNHLCKLEMIDNKVTIKLRFITKTAEKFMKDVNDDKKFLKMKIEDITNNKNWESGGGN